MLNGDTIRALRHARDIASDMRWRGITVPLIYTCMAEKFQALARSGAYAAWVASSEKARSLAKASPTGTETDRLTGGTARMERNAGEPDVWPWPDYSMSCQTLARDARRRPRGSLLRRRGRRAGSSVATAACRRPRDRTACSVMGHGRA
jgi:hypothetical protein